MSYALWNLWNNALSPSKVLKLCYAERRIIVAKARTSVADATKTETPHRNQQLISPVTLVTDRFAGPMLGSSGCFFVFASSKDASTTLLCKAFCSVRDSSMPDAVLAADASPDRYERASLSGEC